jgi:hypothetical protein
MYSLTKGAYVQSTRIDYVSPERELIFFKVRLKKPGIQNQTTPEVKVSLQ